MATRLWRRVVRRLETLRMLASVEEEEYNESARAVEAQTEAAHASGSSNVWAAVRCGDLDALNRQLDAQPWLVRNRGPVGETLLQFAYLHATPAHTALAHALLAREPSLIGTVYEGPLYHGENVLHMTIANEDEAEARWLVARDRTLVDGRADGEFFKHGATAYYGATPLGFAVCSNQANFVRWLVVECGVSLAAADEHGNTAAHMCVYHGRLAMYGLLEELWDKGYGRPRALAATPLSALRNGDGCTPLALAAELDKADMVDALWERSRRQNWRWGSITCLLYPLHNVDTIGQVLAEAAAADGDDSLARAMGLGVVAAGAVPPSGRIPTVLQLAVARERYDVIMQPNIQHLCDLKWSRFARGAFVMRAFAMATFLAIFAVASILRSRLAGSEQRLMRSPATCSPDSAWTCAVVSGCEAATLALAAWKAVAEVRRIRRAGFAAYTSMRGMGFIAIVCLWLGLACLAASVVTDLVAGPALAHIPHAAAAVFSYLHAAWFLLGYRLTGPFIVMIARMLTVDLIRFAAIFTLFLAGFTQMFFLLDDASDDAATAAAAAGTAAPDAEVAAPDGADAEGMGRGAWGFMMRLRSLFDVMISPSLPGDGAAPYEQVLIPIFIVLASITLLNTLIAMLGDTYTRIQDTAERQFQMERARIILSIEDEMTDRERVAEAGKYWTSVNNHPFLQREVQDDAVFDNATRSATLNAESATVAALPQAPANTTESVYSVALAAMAVAASGSQLVPSSPFGVPPLLAVPAARASAAAAAAAGPATPAALPPSLPLTPSTQPPAGEPVDNSAAGTGLRVGGGGSGAAATPSARRPGRLMAALLRTSMSPTSFASVAAAATAAAAAAAATATPAAPPAPEPAAALPVASTAGRARRQRAQSPAAPAAAAAVSRRRSSAKVVALDA